MSLKTTPRRLNLFAEDRTNGEVFSPYLAKNEKAMQSIHAALTKGASKPDDVGAFANPRFWIIARAGRLRLSSSGSIEEIKEPIFRISGGKHSLRFGILHAARDHQRNLHLTTLVMMALALIDARLQQMDEVGPTCSPTAGSECDRLRREITDLILSMQHQMYEAAVDALWTREAWQEALQRLQVSRSRSRD